MWPAPRRAYLGRMTKSSQNSRTTRSKAGSSKAGGEAADATPKVDVTAAAPKRGGRRANNGAAQNADAAALPTSSADQDAALQASGGATDAATEAQDNPVGKTDAAHQQGQRGTEAQFAQLINHSYLTEEGFDTVAETLQRNVATTISLYLKLKKFHWDIRGRHFRELHLAYDDFIAKIFPSIDEQAERLVMLGGSPVSAPSDLEKYSVVQVPTETIHDAREQLTALVDDFTRVARSYRDDSNAVDDAGDPATSDMYNAILLVMDEVRWMTQAMLDDRRMD